MKWNQIAQAKAQLDKESGAVFKDWGGRLRVALAFPNTYYVGMSSLALQIIYQTFNALPDVVCERVFWDKGGRQAGRSLISLESQHDIDAFDVLAFTISYEMDYFNVVEMLLQAGIPPLAAERSADATPDGPTWPLLIAGGPGVTMNPEPMAPFFDAIVIGEGEEVIPQLTQIFRSQINDNRLDLLAVLDQIPGVYVPLLRAENRDWRAESGDRRASSTHNLQSPISNLQSPPPKIQRLWVRDLQAYRTASALYTPDTEFANLHLMEIARGCGRGCRFCLAGYVYRPAREQPLARLLDWAKQGLQHGDRIGLVSAAVSDHTEIDEMAVALRQLGARISVSSMRTDPISVPLVRALAESGTQTLTIAPEAGSQRLRNVINKTQGVDDLMAAVELAEALKFPQLKLYFMIGHPTETDEDIEALVQFTLAARKRFKRRLAINATPFVPKAHTPFQWMAMADESTLKRRQAMIDKRLRPHQVAVRAESPQWAQVQAVLARGDRRLAPVLLALAAQGDLTIRGFHAALADAGLDASQFIGEFAHDRPLPWRIVESGVSDNFFDYEWRLTQKGETGSHCPPDSAGCLTCQACDPAWAFRFSDGKPAKRIGTHTSAGVLKTPIALLG
ncbi:MAG: radical SAM protein [Anaerolineae bacterium]